MAHIQDYHGTRNGFAVGDLPRLPKEKVQRLPGTGAVVDVYGPEEAVWAGIWSERRTTVRLWAQVKRETGEILFLNGIKKGTPPLGAFQMVEHLIK